MTKYLHTFAYIAARILPKRKIIVLRGFPAYEDNLLAIYSELSKRKIKKIVWIVADTSKKPPISLNRGTILVKKNSFLDIYYSLIAKYIFITHGHFLKKTPQNQISINLWHGIPFKKIGNLLGVESRSDTYMIATSEFTRKIFEKSFDTPKENILITGQPRTDRMINVNKENVLRKIFNHKHRPQIIIFWLPTFRHNAYQNHQTDGQDLQNIFNCSDFSIEKFNELLIRHDAICFAKPHPMAVARQCVDSSNVKFISEEWLQHHSTSLYELLGITQCLISDISSVIADFMLLDKPIVLLFEDIDIYKNNRGFSLNPITDYLPAKVNKNFSEFMIDIDCVLLNKDIYPIQRKKLKNLFFTYTDANASARIIDKIGID